jgi:hypothetical protein
MNKGLDIAAMVVVVAGIMVLVRPGSQGPKLVDAFGKAFEGGLTVATGSGVPAGFQKIGW